MVGESVCYVDASALVKLVLPEPESQPLLTFLAKSSRHVTHRIAIVEAVRAVTRREPAAQPRAAEVFTHLDLVDLDAELIDTAAVVEPAGLRTLDAIHLAGAFRMGADLSAVVTYDQRLADAARAAGLRVVSPA